MKRACLAASTILRKGAGECIDAITAAIQRVLELVAITVIVYVAWTLQKCCCTHVFGGSGTRQQYFEELGQRRSWSIEEGIQMGTIWDGHVECDASIIDGDSGAFGAVGAVPGVRNAIEIAALLAKEQISGSSLLGRISPMYDDIFFRCPIALSGTFLGLSPWLDSMAVAVLWRSPLATWRGETSEALSPFSIVVLPNKKGALMALKTMR
ncbi:hypothetical protein HAX54_046598 [Datura stramonium]|uniref:Uncharacterized protein n=1 Tax=Datura stramonium TaxID=4076 RepID=A0ABS8WHC2_DATST|nr:hypothetical protein [Datura stramonium]